LSESREYCSWEDLSFEEQTYKLLKAEADKVFFCTDPYFLGEKLWPVQKEVIADFYKEDRYTESILVWGMRSSKTYMLSLFTCIELGELLLKDWRKICGLAPYSPIFVTIVAVGEKQAQDTVWAQAKPKIMNSPFFRHFGAKALSDTIFFKQRPNIILRCLSASSATVAGRTNKAVCIDEMSKFQETEGPRGAWKVYYTLKHSTKTFKKHGHTFIAGSPIHPTDILMTLYRRGLRRDDVYTSYKATWEVNPNFTKEDFATEFSADPLAALRDFGVEPQAGEDVFFRNPAIIRYETEKPNLLEMLYDFFCTSKEVKLELPPYDYVLAGDPAPKHNAFGFALGHTEGDYVIVDGALKVLPEREIDPVSIRDFLLLIADTVPVRYAYFDTWTYPEALYMLKQKGVTVVNHIVKKEDYVYFKKLCYEKRVVLPNYEPLKVELESLLTKGTKIECPRSGSKDIADAVVNCIYGLTHQVRLRPAKVFVEVF